MREALERVRRSRYVGVAELAATAAEVLREAGPAQGKGTVSEVPDERTVRYYISEGLLSPASGREGTASVFGYLHLLQLLAVKKLQAERLPISKIRELVDGKNERQLERILGDTVNEPAPGETAESGKNEATRYLETLLMRSVSRPPAAPQNAHPPAPSLRRPAPSSQTTQARGWWSWERVEVEPGLEIHVRGDYQLPSGTKGLRRLTDLIVRALEAFGQRSGKED